MSSSEQDKTDQSGIVVKDYSTLSTRKLNKFIKIRNKQIATEEAINARGTWFGYGSVHGKSLRQLKYELEAMTNILMERSLTLT